MKKFALAGNPNCGKTTLFNALTGATAHVGNWPGVTVDKKEGTYKKCPQPVTIQDLPGIYSLSPYTPEEVISRQFILDQKPDCVINIVDATNLERNLYLTTQIMEIEVPIVVALNMMDDLEANGDKIDAAQLEKRLGLPVVPICALKGENIDLLMEKAYAQSEKKRDACTVLDDTPLGHLISDCKIALEGQSIDNALFHAVKLVELDQLERDMHPSSAKMVEQFKQTFSDDIFGGDFEAMIADRRYRYITSNYSPALKRARPNTSGSPRSEKADRVLTHKVWGIPIFLVIMFFIFNLTFSENFLFLSVFINDNWVSFAGTAMEGVFGAGAINSPGVVIFNLLDVGLSSLTQLATDGLVLAGTPQWLTGLLCDGVLSGLFAVLGFLPQILMLFLLFSILEDTGYMARIAFILDRAFRKFGLSGRAFMPLVMGFGCSVPAMINTRTLVDQRERTATIRIIPFFSCGAKLPVLTAVAGAIALKTGIGGADIITYSMYVLGIAVAIISMLVMRKTSLKGQTTPFIMELPAYHKPLFSSLMIHLWDKAKHFIQKAFTIILASTVVIWLATHFTFTWSFLPDEQMNQSILANIGQFVQPIFTPLGFGSQLSSFGWVFVVGAISGLIAKENVVATLGALSASVLGVMVDIEADGGAMALSQLAQATGITVPALIAFIAFNMLTIPCFAAVATARAELPTRQSFTNTVLFWLVVSFGVSSAIYLVGSFWWTSFLFAALFVLLWLTVKLYGRRQPKAKKLATSAKTAATSTAKKHSFGCCSDCSHCPYGEKKDK